MPGEYAQPAGSVLVAMVDGEPAGCCAFRPLTNTDHLDACEMKRLFVRRAFRGFGLGRLLVEQVMWDARLAGYTTMLLDTLSDMETARALYQESGFVEVAPYYHNPIPERTTSRWISEPHGNGRSRKKPLTLPPAAFC